jgi:hydrogenase maturation protease
MIETLVIGVGSPNGDDGAAWAALEQLACRAEVQAAGEAIVLESLDRPGATVIGRWQGVRKVVLVDAVRSGAPAGTLHRIAAKDLLSLGCAASSHGFGVAESIRLAIVLGALPEQLVILGIEAGAMAPGRAPLSPEVIRALPDLVDALVREAVFAGDHGQPVARAPTSWPGDLGDCRDPAAGHAVRLRVDR